MMYSDTFAYTILLDPGHGGKDLGAIGKYKKRISKSKVHHYQNIYEKDLALSITKKVHYILKKKFSTYLTRTTDRTVTLQERANMAEKLSADLFVSIHLNASKKHSSNGYEIYYLNNHKDQAVQKVEEVENSKISVGSKDTDVNQILIDLVIQKTVEQSKKLSTVVHKEIQKKVSKKYKIRDRGIKPGLFYVLALAKRPGILIELGFVSNQKELKKMLRKDVQNYYAVSIAKGIEKYVKQNMKKSIPLF
jgi:N-acetylmuramoyl-L-alanine amidase